MRFDGFRYRDCKWCGGNGCVYCQSEADAEYARQFPRGPEPIATFDTTQPEDVSLMKHCIGGEALNAGGIEEVMRRCLKASRDKNEKDAI